MSSLPEHGYVEDCAEAWGGENAEVEEEDGEFGNVLDEGVE